MTRLIISALFLAATLRSSSQPGSNPGSQATIPVVVAESSSGAPRERVAQLAFGSWFRDDRGAPPYPLPVATSVPPPLPVVPPATSILGYATWFATGPNGLYGAAGPALRKMLGLHWRGQSVTVCARSCIRVTLNDWCACGPRHGFPTLIDLSDEAFRVLAPLSRGTLRVVISY